MKWMMYIFFLLLPLINKSEVKDTTKLKIDLPKICSCIGESALFFNADDELILKMNMTVVVDIDINLRTVEAKIGDEDPLVFRYDSINTTTTKEGDHLKIYYVGESTTVIITDENGIVLILRADGHYLLVRPCRQRFTHWSK